MDRVEIKDVRLPKNLQRAMAAEAEATREARAKVMIGTLRRVKMILTMLMTKVIAAEGEQKSSTALKEAADTISQSPAALQLRYLQVQSTDRYLDTIYT